MVLDLHPHLMTRRLHGPPKLADHDRDGFNDRLAGWITRSVGTMWAFYAFTVLALVSLPSVLRSGSAVVIVGWVAQTFLQLVLLAVLQTSSNRSGKAGDARALATFNDTEAIVHTLLQLEDHLDRQDKLVTTLLKRRIDDEDHA